MIDSLKGFLLGAVDRFNVAASPFAPFTRALDSVDKKPLAEKAAFYRKDILDNWVKNDGRLFWSMSPNDLGDQAIWHGFATAAFAFGGEKEIVSKLLAGHELLQNVGGLNRLCRGVDYEAGPSLVDPTRDYFRANGYRFIQDASESSLIGHLFGLWSVYFMGMSEFDERLERMLDGLAERIVLDDFQLRDQLGRPARHGDLRPLSSPLHFGKRKPVAVAAVAALFGLAFKLTAYNKYRVLYQEWTKDNAQDIFHPETHFLWVHPQYQDILAYMVLAMLTNIEMLTLRRPWFLSGLSDAMGRQWAKNKEEGNSFYTYLADMFGATVSDRHLDAAEQTLHEFNTNVEPFRTGKKKGQVVNSGGPYDSGFSWGPKWARGGKRLSLQPLPVYLRPAADIFWQRNPYELDGVSDQDFSGIDFLCAYRLGQLSGGLP